MAAVRSNSAPASAASRSQSTSPPHPSTKSKRQRTKHACDECRRAQKKCDGVQPRCKRCYLNDTNCTYTPHKGRGRPVEYHARHHNAQNASAAAAAAAADVVPFEEVFAFNTPQSPSAFPFFFPSCDGASEIRSPELKDESIFTMNTSTTTTTATAPPPVMSTMLSHSLSTSTAASSSGPLTPISPGGSSSSSSPQHDFPHPALPFDDYHPHHHPYHHLPSHAQLSYPPQQHQAPQLPQLFLPSHQHHSHGLSSVPSITGGSVSDFESPRETSSPSLSPSYYPYDDDTHVGLGGFSSPHHHQPYNTASSSSSSASALAPSQAPITSSSAGGPPTVGSGAVTAGLSLSSGTSTCNSSRNRSASVRKRSPLALDTNVSTAPITGASSSDDTATTTTTTTNMLHFPTSSGGLSSPVAGSPYEATNEVFRPHPYAPNQSVTAMAAPPQMQHRQLSLPNDLSPRPYPLAHMAIGGGPSHPSLHHTLLSNYPSHHYHPYMHAQRQQQQQHAVWEGASTRQMTISSPSPVNSHQMQLLHPTGGNVMSSPAAVSTSLSPSSPPASIGGGSGGSGSGGSRDDNHSSSGSGCGGSTCGSSPGMMMMHEHEQQQQQQQGGSEQGSVMETMETGNTSGSGTAHVIQDLGVISSDHIPSSSYPLRLHVQQQDAMTVATAVRPDSPSSSNSNSSNDHNSSNSNSNHSRTPTVTYSSRTVTSGATTSSPQTPSSETAPDGSLLFSMHHNPQQQQQQAQTQVQEDSPQRELSTTPSATGVYYPQTSSYNEYHQQQHHAQHQQQQSEFSSLYYTYDPLPNQHHQQIQPDTQSHVNTRSYDSIPHPLPSTSSSSDHHPRGGVISSPVFEYQYDGQNQSQHHQHHMGASSQQYPYDYHHQHHQQSHEIGG